MSEPSQIVLTFLESVGKRQDAELYLRLFRQLPKPSFALVSLDAMVLSEAMGLVVDALLFLARLGLYPVLVRGLDDMTGAEDSSPAPASSMQEEFVRELRHRRLQLVTYASTEPDLVELVKSKVEHEHAVCVDFAASPSARGFEALGELAVALNSRKLVILRSRGGVGPRETRLLQLSPNHFLQTDENGIGVINLRTDLDALLGGPYLDTEERRLLSQVSTVHQQAPALITSVTSPLNLLRELFTVRGAGTLVKTGSSVENASSYSQVDRQRVVALLETTFGRSLNTQFFDKPPLRIYFESNYRGVAIIHSGLDDGAAYLTKFAVVRSAQGEGLGRDLWEAILRDFPRLYWRARVTNPIAAWYRGQCDGMHRTNDWCVYWRGLPIERVAAFSEDALQRPHDLV